MISRSISGTGCTLAALVLAVSGCAPSPLDQENNLTLQRAVDTAAERELMDLPGADQRLETIREPSDVEETLASRREQLDAMGASLYLDSRLEVDPASLGPDLTGTMQEVRGLNMQEAILTSVENNLGLQISRLQPAINEADVVAAEAVFDALFFAEGGVGETDRPLPLTAIDGTIIGAGQQSSFDSRFATGVRKQLTSGGLIEVSTDFNGTDNKTPTLDQVPDPAFDAAIRLGLTQPLLRGFGSEVNTAAIRLARNAERGSIQDLHRDLEGVVTETEVAYWNLALAWRELSIRRWLVEVGMQVRDVLARRREFDTTQAQYSDAVARVEQRRADVIRSRRRVRGASDNLKVLLNDPQTTVGSEVIFAPIEQMIDAPISYSLRDASLTALQNRPEIQQAILAIDDSSIREVLADNGRLPLLNLSAEASFLGLNDGVTDAYGNVTDGDFIEYFVGLALEIPVGNRAAEADFRSARLQRSSAVIAYRRVVQEVVLDVKSALRDVRTNFELIQATRSNRIAQAENLRALQAEEETLASLTPEFLDLKFRLQDRLAAAQFEEVQAMVNFDQAVARLYQAMGVALEMNRIEIEISEDPAPVPAMPRVLEPTDEAIAQATAALRRGSVVAFPTETVYGLGGDTFSPLALQLIYAIKGRPADNPLIAHVHGPPQAAELTTVWDGRAAALADRFWPGPLTLIVPRDPNVPEAASAGLATIAVRSPAHPVARRLLEAWGGSISAPSANRSGHVSPTTAAHVRDDLPDVDDLIVLDGGRCDIGIESTVLDLTADPPRILRPGSVTEPELRKVVGDVDARPVLRQDLGPGTSEAHYAPRTPAELVGSDDLGAEIADAIEPLAVICFDASDVGRPHLAFEMPQGAGDYARKLYEVLRQADETHVERILIERPPLSNEMWRAVHDRLRRATQRPV